MQKKPVRALPVQKLCCEGQIFGVGSFGATFYIKPYGNDNLNESFSLHFSNAFAHIFGSYFELQYDLQSMPFAK